MKVFISWSKERSKKVALLLHDWLQCVIQSIDPWMSDVDIDRGSIWFNDINENLNESTNGIICLTKSNINESWILFEAGALSKGLDLSRVYTFLIDLDPTDITGPLSQFNHTLPTKESMKKLISVLNNRSEKQLSQSVINEVFNMYWPSFNNKFTDIINNTDETDVHVAQRSDSDVLLEILRTTRLMNRRVTYIENRIISECVEFSDEINSFTKYPEINNDPISIKFEKSKPMTAKEAYRRKLLRDEFNNKNCE